MPACRAAPAAGDRPPADGEQTAGRAQLPPDRASCQGLRPDRLASCPAKGLAVERVRPPLFEECNDMSAGLQMKRQIAREDILPMAARSEEPTSELQSLLSTSYAVFCLKKKNTYITNPPNPT